MPNDLVVYPQMKPENRMLPVFVYGSLKRGFHNNKMMDVAKAVFKKETTTQHKSFSLFSLGAFPALHFAKIPEETPFYVKGELYDVPVDAIDVLDRFEAGYRREVIILEGYSKAFAYFMRPHKAPRIFPDGYGVETVSWHMKGRE